MDYLGVPGNMAQPAVNTDEKGLKTSNSSDRNHVVLVGVAVGLMFAAFVISMVYYGKGAEAAAAGILGLFLAAVTAVVGFVFGVKTGTASGLKAADQLVSTTRKAASSNAEKGLQILEQLQGAVEPALEELSTKAPAGTMLRTLAREANAPRQVKIDEFRTQFSRQVDELRGRLKVLQELS